MHGRPVLRSIEPFTRDSARKAILAVLGSLLGRRGRKGKVALARATVELGGDRRAGEEASGVHWDYWLARWGSLFYRERLHHARTETLPLLLRDRPPRSGPPPRPAPPPFLEPMPRCDQAPHPASRASPPSFEPDLDADPTPEDTARSLGNLLELGWDPEMCARLARNEG